MNSKWNVLFLVILLLAAVGCGGTAEEAEEAAAPAEEPVQEAEPTADEQVAELDAMCAAAAEDMAARQAESSLYERLGGREAIQAVVADTVARHGQNETIAHTLEGVDTANLIAQVTEFLVVATGGEGDYTGREMPAAHAHLGLSNEHFVAAGDDVAAAMEAAGAGENEIQEVLCAFASLRDQVVTQ